MTRKSGVYSRTLISGQREGRVTIPPPPIPLSRVEGEKEGVIPEQSHPGEREEEKSTMFPAQIKSLSQEEDLKYMYTIVHDMYTIVHTALL